MIPERISEKRVSLVSGIFKASFVVVFLAALGLLLPPIFATPSMDGFGSIGAVLGVLLVWGFSIAILLLAVFARSLLPRRALSLAYGVAIGGVAAVSLVLLVLLVMPRNPGATGSPLMPMMVYVLVTASVLLFAWFMERSAGSEASSLHVGGKIRIMSLVIGLFLSLGASWLAYPDFHFDRLGPKSPGLIEYERCLARSAPGQYNSEGCLTPNDPHIIGFPPQSFGFPVHSSNIFGNPTSFPLYFFVIIPNWLLWSIAVYLLAVVGRWLLLRTTRV